MNKKYFSIISLMFVVSILFAGCSPADDISPSSRLVGHWEAVYEKENTPGEIYLGELSTDGEGKFFTTLDFVDYCERTYEIMAEDEDTYTVRLYKEFTSKYEDSLFEFRDDSSISWKNLEGELIREFNYVDSETEPAKLGPLAEKDNEYLTTTLLTGHWGHIPEADGEFNENFHVYFGRINEDGEGIYYSISDTNAVKFYFKIFSEDGGNYNLQIKYECGGDEFSDRWEVSEDGQNLNWILEDEIFRFKYLDSSTEP